MLDHKCGEWLFVGVDRRMNPALRAAATHPLTRQGTTAH
jgi:hypothetical protein